MKTPSPNKIKNKTENAFSRAIFSFLKIYSCAYKSSLKFGYFFFKTVDSLYQNLDSSSVIPGRCFLKIFYYQHNFIRSAFSKNLAFCYSLQNFPAYRFFFSVGTFLCLQCSVYSFSDNYLSYHSLPSNLINQITCYAEKMNNLLC